MNPYPWALDICVLAEDIMYEVFRAMKTLDFEWKILNAYHVIVRRKPDTSSHEPVRDSCILPFPHSCEIM